MGPKFDNLILLSSGELEVKGPFETNGRVLDDVVVRFLIIADGKQTIFGTAMITQDACECLNCEAHPVKRAAHKRDVHANRPQPRSQAE